MNAFTTAVRALLSNMLFALGRATGSDRLIRRSVTLDSWNLRARRGIFRRRDLSEKETLEQLFQTFEVLRALRADCATGQPVLGDNLLSLAKSEAQLFQDVFVLKRLNFKKGGFFVEIGVGDGRVLSNSYLLETDYHWSGILAEPNRVFARGLRTMRTAIVDDRAVFSQSGLHLDFLEDEAVGELSTLSRYSGDDGFRRGGKTYKVTTVSINDLLEQHGAPREIDYVSIDTEASEFSILESFDFEKYTVSIFTIEHNGVAEKLDAITALLVKNGFVRQAEEFSHFDAWFVNSRLVAGTA